MSLVDKLREGATRVAEMGEKATHFSELKLGIAAVESKLVERYTSLGRRCYELQGEEGARVFDDEKIATLCKEIQELNTQLQGKQLELEKFQAKE